MASEAQAVALAILRRRRARSSGRSAIWSNSAWTSASPNPAARKVRHAPASTGLGDVQPIGRSGAGQRRTGSGRRKSDRRTTWAILLRRGNVPFLFLLFARVESPNPQNEEAPTSEDAGAGRRCRGGQRLSGRRLTTAIRFHERLAADGPLVVRAVPAVVLAGRPAIASGAAVVRSRGVPVAIAIARRGAAAGRSSLGRSSRGRSDRCGCRPRSPRRPPDQRCRRRRPRRRCHCRDGPR